MCRRRSLLVLLLGWAALVYPEARTAVPAATERAIQEVSADELRAHVSVLASDALMGRGVGHAGNREAEEYIAAALKRAQVPPGRGDSYLQPVEVYEPTLGARGHLTMTDADGTPLTDLAIGRDFYPLPASADVDVSGPLVWAGYGISAPQWRHDEYATIDARGAIVLVDEGAPVALLSRPTLGDDDKRSLASLERKIDDARAAGAAGVIVVRRSLPDVGAIWPERTSPQSASYRLYDRMRARPMAVATLSKAAAEPVRHALGSGRAVRATLAPGVVPRRTTIHNVIGALPGRSAAAELVVLGAHLDHDGVDESGRIYNGADDNASGTAAVLALAAAFARAAAAGERAERTIVFALWNGEEKGSLGSEYYVTSPVPGGRIAANVTLDMVGRSEDIDPGDVRLRGFPRTSRSESANVVHLLGYSYSPEFARLVERANAAVKLDVKEDYDRGAQHLVRRSDNWPFLEHGVPAVFLTTGLHPDYHTPADDTDRIEFGKLERIAELAGRVVWLAADGPAPRLKTK